MKSEAIFERQIHMNIVQLLKLTAVYDVVYFHVANERRTSPREGAFLKRLGVLAGVSDFTLIIPRRAADGGVERPQIAFLEVKRPGARLSAAQEQFRDDVTSIGCLWGLVYSTDAAASLLKSWGAIRTADPVTAQARRAA